MQSQSCPEATNALVVLPVGLCPPRAPRSPGRSGRPGDELTCPAELGPAHLSGWVHGTCRRPTANFSRCVPSLTLGQLWGLARPIICPESGGQYCDRNR